MNTLNFSCTKCGSCCTSAPNLTFSEFLNMSADFYVKISHCSALSYENAPLSRQMVDYYGKFCHTFYLPEKKCHLFYFTSLKAITRASSVCPKLKNNLCSIQHKKPLHCTVAPLNPMVSEEDQVETFRDIWLPKIENKQFQCQIDSRAPLLIRDNQIDNSIIQDSFYQFLIETRNFTDLYIKYYLDNEERLKQHISYCFEAAKVSNSSLFYTSALDLLEKYYNLGLIDKIVLQNICQNQIDYLDKEISLALAQRNLNDRATTSQMKEELSRYKYFLIALDKEELGDDVQIY